MPTETDVVEGALKLKGLVDELCATSLAEYTKLLPTLFSVLIPSNISNVVVGVQQPGDDRRDNLWVRLDNSGDFIGLYVYAQGQWRQVSPVENQLFKIAYAGANSTIPIPGFTLATDGSRLTTSQKNFIKLQWHWNNDVVGSFYDIYEVYYSGF